MGHKVLISILGTGFYDKCKYVYNGLPMPETRFIQEAMLDAYDVRSSWNKDDKICLFLTDSAKKNNWEICGERKKHKDSAPEFYQGLKSVLESKNLTATICPIDIPNGKDEKEMWQIFETLYNAIGEGDELYFDLTHSFRYLPMLLLIFGNYAKFMKNAKVVAITYGNYEARNERMEAPIVNLMPLSALQDFTEAAASFKKFGKMGDLSALLAIAQKGDFAEMSKRARNIFKDNLESLYKGTAELEKQLSTCRGQELAEGKMAEKIVKNIADVQGEYLPKPLQLIVSQLAKPVSPLAEGGEEDKLKAAINWCAAYGMTQQAYTLGQESLITILLNRFKDIFADMNKRYARDYLSALLAADEKALVDETKWRGMLAEHRPLTRAFLKLQWVKDLRKSYGQLTRNRNQINHAGFIGKVSAKEIIEQFNTYYNKCFSIIQGDLESPVIALPTEKVFINFSNHPSRQWGEEQKLAATEYGPCVDLPFPQVDPLATEEVVEEMAEKCVADILRLTQDKLATVHVMGEMSLAFRVVTHLKHLRVPCVASTTYRIVNENADGTKQVKFCFERFRPY